MNEIKKELLNRRVNLVDYYTKRLNQEQYISDKGRKFKVYSDYPYRITDVFINPQNKLRVDLELEYKSHKIPVRSKPLENIKFQLLEKEKKGIIDLVLKNNLNELFHKYWYLRLIDIEEYLKNEFILENYKNYFVEVENLEDTLHLLILLFINLYNLDITFRRSKNEIEKMKQKKISFIFFKNNGKIKDIYLHKDSKKIFLLFHNKFLLIPKKDRKQLQQEMKQETNYKIQFIQNEK